MDKIRSWNDIQCIHCGSSVSTRYARKGHCKRCTARWLQAGMPMKNGKRFIPEPVLGKANLRWSKLWNLAAYWELIHVQKVTHPETICLRLGISNRTRERYSAELNKVGSDHPALLLVSEHLKENAA